MVFIGGPRQVGKTTLCQSVYPAEKRLYLNWDIDDHRTRILKREFGTQTLWIFDKLHKYRQWRNLLKGIYDQHKREKKILVTGSARLDWYCYSGDSHQGKAFSKGPKLIQDLFQLSGFPEPFFSGSKAKCDRWSDQYQSRLVREEVGAVESLKDLGQLELTLRRLPELVGSPLSINSLREDLQVHHTTLQRWLDVFERMYFIFRVPPLGSTKLKAVKKEQKHYHFDWNVVKEPGPRYENLIASHLLKHVQWLQDTQGKSIELRYFRDIEGREVDFVLTDKKIPPCRGMADSFEREKRLCRRPRNPSSPSRDFLRYVDLTH